MLPRYLMIGKCLEEAIMEHPLPVLAPSLLLLLLIKILAIRLTGKASLAEKNVIVADQIYFGRILWIELYIMICISVLF